ncbi:hypothetical protein H0H87_006293 [Tephrocybe sp. NHM501043]|nr:hypothetical protein H0H87_006293 [Tephrocybe sp. NHM501043]
MPFIPLPTASVCNLESKSSIKIAQAISRTWYNLDPSLWSIIPERITLHADGQGEFSSPFTIYTQDGKRNIVMSSKFKWSLARDGIFSGLEEMNDEALFDTIPKLIRSEEAWTRKPWIGGRVPAYLRIDCDGPSSLEPDTPILSSFTSASSDELPLPVELLEAIFLLAADDVSVQKLGMVCKHSRELIMKPRRRDAFYVLAERFLRNGLALWIDCGHFDPASNRDTPPTSFYGMQAHIMKNPRVCKYYGREDPQGDWQLGWNMKARMYYSCPLPLPNRENPTLWRRLQGDKEYDTHPEVDKFWTSL